MGIFKIIYNWIENLEGKHIIYLAIISASLLIVGYIGQGPIIDAMDPTGEELAGVAEVILTNIHLGIIISGWIFLASCIVALLLFFQIS